MNTNGSIKPLRSQ